MNYQDELEQQKIDAKNNVEEYVYSMRDKVRNIHYIIDCVHVQLVSHSITSSAELLAGRICNGEREGGFLERALSH